MTGLVGVDEANHRLFFTGNKDGVAREATSIPSII